VRDHRSDQGDLLDRPERIHHKDTAEVCDNIDNDCDG